YEGHAYLIGEYESRAQVERAVAIAKSVEGVHRVTTYMLPKRAQDYCGTTDNLDIYRQVKQLLIADNDIWSTNIDVKTIQCNVVLLGIVGSNKEKADAYAHAKSIKGVRSVKSYITVK
ncbi:BON domain-containing protein, partial [Pseudodesulfovibrio sp.]|nr:BON domain-containing protein [Pseudodesulfovibrio sp.]